MSEQVVVGKAVDLPPGQRTIVAVKGLSIGVFNVKGEFYALNNRCPHQGGPLCLGRLTGLGVATIPGQMTWTRSGEILRCPWHMWEFDIKTGRALVDPVKARVKQFPVTVEATLESHEIPRAETYPVTVESGWLVVHL